MTYHCVSNEIVWATVKVKSFECAMWTNWIILLMPLAVLRSYIFLLVLSIFCDNCRYHAIVWQFGKPDIC